MYQVGIVLSGQPAQTPSPGLTLKVLYHTIPHQLCRCEVKDVHCLQSFVSTHSEENDSLFFHPLFAVTDAFNVGIFERGFSLFFLFLRSPAISLGFTTFG